MKKPKPLCTPYELAQLALALEARWRATKNSFSENRQPAHFVEEAYEFLCQCEELIAKRREMEHA